MMFLWPLSLISFLQSQSLLAILLQSLIAVVLCHIAYYRRIHAACHVPGPFLASFSQLWLLWHTIVGIEQHYAHATAHAKYGSVIRIAPKKVIFSDPRHYPLVQTWDKARWWYCFRFGGDDHPITGHELNVEKHDVKRGRIAHAFSMTSMLSYEARIDRHIGLFARQIGKFCNDGIQVNMAEWTKFLIMDIAMDVLYSHPLGDLESGRDVGNIIGFCRAYLTFTQIVGIYPILYKIMQLPGIKNICGVRSTDKEGIGFLMGVAELQVHSRSTEFSKISAPCKDMLQSMLNWRSPTGERNKLEIVQNEVAGATVAGSDPTGTILRASILYIATQPHVRERLLAEIDTADAAGQLSTPVRYNEARALPYLEAVIRETFRIYPPSAAPLYRQVPDLGATIDGVFIPAGTSIGINPWMAGRCTAIFGKDVDEFRPERWLAPPEVESESQEAKERRRLQKQGEINFGSGTFSCLGKNLVMMTLYKTLVELHREFDVFVVDPFKPLEAKNKLSWVHNDFWCRVVKRNIDRAK